MTLIDLINSVCWSEPQDHMKVTLFDKVAYVKNDDEHNWEEIELNVKNVAKYGNCIVRDIDIEDNKIYCCVEV